MNDEIMTDDPSEPRTPEAIDELIDDSVSDEDIENFAADVNPPDGPDQAGGFGPDGIHDALRAPLPPPPTAPPHPQSRPLVRDPLAPGAGVASGLGHYLDIDPVLVRLVFIVGLLFTGPVAVIAYLVAWAAIPKSPVWPPVGGSGARRQVSGRTLGLVVAGIGAALLLGFNLEGLGSVLAPLVLVGLGVWLLRQPPKPVQPAVAYSPAQAGYPNPPVAPGAPVSGAYYGWDEHGGPAAPVKTRRSTGARFFRFGVVAMLLLVPLSAIVVLGSTARESDGVVEFSVGSADFSIGETTFAPAAPDELSETYSLDVGSFTFDLTGLDDSMFTQDQTVEISTDVGEVVVRVPEDLSVQVSAQSDVGEIVIFGTEVSGIDLEFGHSDSDPVLELLIDSNAGEITVERVSS